MLIYCTSKNAGPSWQSDPVTMIYLGTSFYDALHAVGDFKKYEKTHEEFPKTHPDIYTALPRKTEIAWHFVKYFMADGWWYSIVEFELYQASDSAIALDHELKSND